MIRIERQTSPGQLEKVCDAVGWSHDFSTANFETGHYYLITERESHAMVIATPMANGVLECHAAKYDTMSSEGFKSSAIIIIDELKKDYEALFCLIEKENIAANKSIKRVGFEFASNVANYNIYTRGL